MPCGAILYFDDETDAAIRGLWQIIEDAGLPSIMPGLNYPPHMTLLACDGMDLRELRPRLSQFVAENPPTPIQFHGLGFFGEKRKVIHLAVTPTRALLDFHARFHTLAGPYLTGENSFYLPDSWVPHITLDQDFPLETTGAIIDILLRHPLPKDGLLRELVLADFAPEQQGLTEMFKARLGRFL
jgi:2'-5' RNA ligase